MKILKIKPDAVPIDNIHKFAWDDEDYIEVEVPNEPRPEEPKPMPSLQEQIDQLKKAIFNNI